MQSKVIHDVSYCPHIEKGTPMTTQRNTEFQQLLKAWNDHQDLRKQGGPIFQLVESSAKLEHARRQLGLAA